MKAVNIIIFLFFSNFIIAQNPNIIQVKSVYNFKETVSYIKSNLKEKNIFVFAIFNHQTNAEKVQLHLNPTTVIVFGTPKSGTLLMQKNQNISIELPLKISIIQNSKDEIWISYFKMTEIAKKYQLENNPIILKIEKLFTEITKNLINKKQ